METLKTKAPPGRRERCRGSGLIGAAFFGLYIMYSTFSLEFSDGEKQNAKT